jgi:trans-2,3-dihydro-3-hydroxyanthranilate isomerase
MSMKFYQVDVFADGPYKGNPLAVFPDGNGLTTVQMQTIAREMNLSETSFVTRVDGDGYDVRIFTPAEELPFAGHPTIGTVWLLEHIGAIKGAQIVQTSSGGETPLTLEDGVWWFEREGWADPNLADQKPDSSAALAGALGLQTDDIGLDSVEFGRSGRLMPAFSDAGLSQLMVPVRDLETLARCRPSVGLLKDAGGMGAYCFTAETNGSLRARGFWPGVGVEEDPATGSACAALGIYLADRLRSIELRVRQGVEMGRPSVINMRASDGRVSIGGQCELIFEGTLTTLP